jgi:hypothetical protein
MRAREGQEAYEIGNDKFRGMRGGESKVLHKEIFCFLVVFCDSFVYVVKIFCLYFFWTD